MKLLSIDPSIRSCGWATVDLTEDEAEFKWGAWQISGLNFVMRCHDIKDYIEQEIGEFDEIVLEYPQFFDNERGHVAARRGDTLNLAGIDMFLAGWFQKSASKTHLYTPNQWKGQTRKEITGRRFFQMFGVNYLKLTTDEVDAAMLLVYHCRTKKLIQ